MKPQAEALYEVITGIIDEELIAVTQPVRDEYNLI